MYLLDTSGLRPSDPRTLYLEFIMAQPPELHTYGQTAKFGQYLMDWLIIQSREAGYISRLGAGARASSCDLSASMVSR
jgi:hypothetical protein